MLRFPPGGQDDVTRIMKEAKYAHRHHQNVAAEPWYRLSIWADTPLPDEPLAHTLTRLIEAAGLGQIRIADDRNSRFWWTTAQALYEAGFTILKDFEDSEPAEHYSVVLGEEIAKSIVESFVDVFRGPEQTGRYAG